MGIFVCFSKATIIDGELSLMDFAGKLNMNGVAWWPIDSRAGFVTGRSGFESRSGHLSHCVHPMSKEFTHSWSRSTRPSHTYTGRQNE